MTGRIARIVGVAAVPNPGEVVSSHLLPSLAAQVAEILGESLAQLSRQAIVVLLIEVMGKVCGWHHLAACWTGALRLARREQV